MSGVHGDMQADLLKLIDFCTAADDQESKKEIAVNDRMCPCAARWSMIAIVIYSCMWAVSDRHVVASVARWSAIAMSVNRKNGIMGGH